MQSLQRMLPALVRQIDDSAEARERATFVAWDAVAGEGVARVTVPERLLGRRLHIDVVDATWKRQLEHLGAQYIFRLNSLLGTPVVTQIVFRVDPAAVARAHPEPVSALQPGDVESCAAEISPDAGVIEDRELRDLFLRAAGSCLARQRQATR